ncbi:hypothetical protein [Bradyrhizobium japonicum]|uniref:hypothetical protein n=1 Tax=Bradyrhizobium japonicum TaxID=375 RepID=UPI0027152D37|nr:hypothetical protein [Bradyrhizobium japonicum]WLB24252.1 hypothetical protein QIH95_47690 [Bradyrhizobium japonicum]
MADRWSDDVRLSDIEPRLSAAPAASAAPRSDANAVERGWLELHENGTYVLRLLKPKQETFPE